jgi:hypothetical protein
VIAYQLGISSVAAATGAAYAEFECNGTKRAEIYEIHIFAQTAVAASKTQIGRPGNTPTAGSLTLWANNDAGNAGTATAGVTTTWTTAPTAPAAATVFDQHDFPATIGSAYIATYADNRALVVGPTRSNTQGLVIWNAGSGTGPPLSLTFIGAE